MSADNACWLVQPIEPDPERIEEEEPPSRTISTRPLPPWATPIYSNEDNIPSPQVYVPKSRQKRKWDTKARPKKTDDIALPKWARKIPNGLETDGSTMPERAPNIPSPQVYVPSGEDLPGPSVAARNEALNSQFEEYENGQARKDPEILDTSCKEEEGEHCSLSPEQLDYLLSPFGLAEGEEPSSVSPEQLEYLPSSVECAQFPDQFEEYENGQARKDQEILDTSCKEEEGEHSSLSPEQLDYLLSPFGLAEEEEHPSVSPEQLQYLPSSVECAQFPDQRIILDESLKGETAQAPLEVPQRRTGPTRHSIQAFQGNIRPTQEHVPKSHQRRKWDTKVRRRKADDSAMPKWAMKTPDGVVTDDSAKPEWAMNIPSHQVYVPSSEDLPGPIVVARSVALSSRFEELHTKHKKRKERQDQDTLDSSSCLVQPIGPPLTKIEEKEEEEPSLSTEQLEYLHSSFGCAQEEEEADPSISPEQLDYMLNWFAQFPDQRTTQATPNVSIQAFENNIPSPHVPNNHQRRKWGTKAGSKKTDDIALPKWARQIPNGLETDGPTMPERASNIPAPQLHVPSSEDLPGPSVAARNEALNSQFEEYENDQARKDPEILDTSCKEQEGEHSSLSSEQLDYLLSPFGLAEEEEHPSVSPEQLEYLPSSVECAQFPDQFEEYENGQARKHQEILDTSCKEEEGEHSSLSPEQLDYLLSPFGLAEEEEHPSVSPEQLQYLPSSVECAQFPEQRIILDESLKGETAQAPSEVPQRRTGPTRHSIQAFQGNIRPTQEHVPNSHQRRKWDTKVRRRKADVSAMPKWAMKTPDGVVTDGSAKPEWAMNIPSHQVYVPSSEDLPGPIVVARSVALSSRFEELHTKHQKRKERQDQDTLDSSSCLVQPVGSPLTKIEEKEEEEPSLSTEQLEYLFSSFGCAKEEADPSISPEELDYLLNWFAQFPDQRTTQATPNVSIQAFEDNIPSPYVPKSHQRRKWDTKARRRKTDDSALPKWATKTPEGVVIDGSTNSERQDHETLDPRCGLVQPLGPPLTEIEEEGPSISPEQLDYLLSPIEFEQFPDQRIALDESLKDDIAQAPLEVSPRRTSPSRSSSPQAAPNASIQAFEDNIPSPHVPQSHQRRKWDTKTPLVKTNDFALPKWATKTLDGVENDDSAMPGVETATHPMSARKTKKPGMARCHDLELLLQPDSGIRTTVNTQDSGMPKWATKTSDRVEIDGSAVPALASNIPSAQVYVDDEEVDTSLSPEQFEYLITPWGGAKFPDPRFGECKIPGGFEAPQPVRYQGYGDMRSALQAAQGPVIPPRAGTAQRNRAKKTPSPPMPKWAMKKPGGVKIDGSATPTVPTNQVHVEDEEIDTSLSPEQFEYLITPWGGAKFPDPRFGECKIPGGFEAPQPVRSQGYGDMRSALQAAQGPVIPPRAGTAQRNRAKKTPSPPMPKWAMKKPGGVKIDGSATPTIPTNQVHVEDEEIDTSLSPEQFEYLITPWGGAKFPDPRFGECKNPGGFEAPQPVKSQGYGDIYSALQAAQGPDTPPRAGTAQRNRAKKAPSPPMPKWATKKPSGVQIDGSEMPKLASKPLGRETDRHPNKETIRKSCPGKEVFATGTETSQGTDVKPKMSKSLLESSPRPSKPRAARRRSERSFATTPGWMPGNFPGW